MKPLLASMVVMLSIPSAFAETHLSTAQRQRLMDVLISALNEKGSWISVHAAEGLITIGKGDVVLAAFAPQAETATPPFRIGVWRILARCADSTGQRQSYVERIRTVMLDPTSTDQTHAIEALAKLAAPMTSDAERALVKQIAFGPSNVAPFAAWRIAQVDKSAGLARLVELLGASDPICRCRAGDILAHFQPLTDTQHSALEMALKKEPRDSTARPYLIEAIGGEPLRELARTSPDPASIYIALSELLRTGTPDDLELLWKSFENPNLDVRVASAIAILKISDAKDESHPP